MKVDLHIHTTASDGRWPPERVISEAQERNLGLIAVADHDTIGSVSKCRELAGSSGIRFLNGVEISSRLDGRVYHILGYGFDLEHPQLVGLLSENTEKLERADDAVVEELAARGFEVSLDDYIDYEYDRTRGGWKALNYLIERGVCVDVHDYLERVWRDREVPAFPHPKEVIDVIGQAGGVAIVAHPRAAMEGMRLSEDLLARFQQWDISGLECFHPGHDEAETSLCLEWCDREQLLVTGGSDCHGGLVGREMGVPAVDWSDLRLGVLEQRLAG